MNVNAVARHYDRLTPEERFRLMLAASGRGDDAERDRLANAGARITLSMRDHAPYAHAFDELALLVYVELVDEAARYLDAFERADDGRDLCGIPEDEAEEASEGEGCDADGRPPWRRYLDLALAAGYVLRTKADGWQRFCQRLNVPPWLLWDGLPGCDRLQRALALTERAAFVPEGFVRWLNAVRPADAPELTAAPLTVDGIAAATETAFRQRAAWWGGG